MKLLLYYPSFLLANLFVISSFPSEIIISYMPGPNFEPVKAILRGWPTPLKFVSFDLISSFTIGSNVSLLSLSILANWALNVEIIFFALSSISLISSWLKFTSSTIIYWPLLNISSNVFALFFKKVKDFLILSFLSDLISFLCNLVY